MTSKGAHKLLIYTYLVVGRYVVYFVARARARAIESHESHEFILKAVSGASTSMKYETKG